VITSFLFFYTLGFDSRSSSSNSSESETDRPFEFATVQFDSSSVGSIQTTAAAAACLQSHHWCIQQQRKQHAYNDTS